MDEIVRDLVVSIVAIASIFGILYALLITRHRERMTLMDKGLRPKDFQNKNAVLFGTLRIGLFLIGVAVGIFFGNFTANHFDIPRQGAFIATILCFGGLSLIISYLIERKNNWDKS